MSRQGSFVFDDYVLIGYYTVEADVIFEAVWGEKAMASSANNVMVSMLGLRKKLEDDPSNPKLIRTVWGKGYQLG